jgi:hypothetical protein
MSNRRRIIIIVIAVITGTALSALIFATRSGGKMSSSDLSTLLTNFVFSLAIILGIGFLFIWNKKKKE